MTSSFNFAAIKQEKVPGDELVRASPQRGDMFIAVAPGAQFFTFDVDESNVLLKPFFGTN
jgi:hypothetical protein